MRIPKDIDKLLRIKLTKKFKINEKNGHPLSAKIVKGGKGGKET